MFEERCPIDELSSTFAFFSPQITQIDADKAPVTTLPRFAGTDKRYAPVVSAYICVICGLFSLLESAKPELSA
jgi:hypothetical protein